MGEFTEEVRHQLEDALGELRALRDEIKLQIHLASMETRERWQRVEPQIQESERRLRDSTDQALAGLAELMTTAKEAARKILAEVKRMH